MRLGSAYLIENNLSILRVSNCQKRFLLLLIDFIVTWGKVCQEQVSQYCMLTPTQLKRGRETIVCCQHYGYKWFVTWLLCFSLLLLWLHLFVQLWLKVVPSSKTPRFIFLSDPWPSYLGFPCHICLPSYPSRSGSQSYQWSTGRDSSACGPPGPEYDLGTLWCCSLR